MARKLALAAALTLSGGAAMAACPGMNQMEMNECAASEYQRADAELNAIWSQAKPAADRMNAGAQLLEAQRKWIAYRDAACNAEIAPYAGGSIQPQVWYMCLTRLTAQRSGDLRNFLY